jgi:hypothetical protein
MQNNWIALACMVVSIFRWPSKGIVLNSHRWSLCERDRVSLHSWLVFENAIWMCLLGFDLICLVLASMLDVFTIYDHVLDGRRLAILVRLLRTARHRVISVVYCFNQVLVRLLATCILWSQNTILLSVCVCLCLSEYTSAGILSSAFITSRVYLFCLASSSSSKIQADCLYNYLLEMMRSSACFFLPDSS